MTVDLIESLTGITVAKVARPASQVSIQFFDQDRDRLPTMRLAGATAGETLFSETETGPESQAGAALLPRFRRDWGPRRLSRSGRFLQAALLSSYRFVFLLRLLRSTVITLFLAVGSEEARLRAGHRPPRKLHVRFSRMQLSRRLKRSGMQAKGLIESS